MLSLLCTGVGGPGNAPSSPTFRRFFRPPTDVYKYPDGSGDTQREREREVRAPKRSHGEVKAADSPPTVNTVARPHLDFPANMREKNSANFRNFFCRVILDFLRSLRLNLILNFKDQIYNSKTLTVCPDCPCKNNK